MVVVARAGSVFLFALALTGAAGATGAPGDQAEFHYLQGFDASGEFEGTCQTAGYRFATDTSRALTLDADEAKLVLYKTWWNTTVLDIDGAFPVETVTQGEQASAVMDLPEGPIHLDWGPGAHVFLTHAHSGTTREMVVDVNGTNWTSGEPRSYLPAGPGFYYQEHDDLIWQLETGIDGPARWLDTGQETLHVAGHGFLLFDGLTVRADGFELDMPPYEQHGHHDETPVSYTSSYLYTHAVLETEGLETSVPAGHGRLACSDLDWSGTGAVTYRSSTGEVTHANATHTIDRQQLTLNGEFSNHEEPVAASTPWGERLQIETTSQGAFNTGADYQPLGDPQRIPPVAMQMTLLALIVSAALATWKLFPGFSSHFTRIKRDDALKHPLRTLLHDLAHQQPGTSLAEVVHASGRSYNTIRHHAQLLVKLEIISTIRFTKEIYLFPPKTAKAQARKVVSLRSEGVRYLVDRLDEEGRPMREIRARLQEDFRRGPAWATRIVQQAERSGLVSREKTEQGVKLCATPQ